MKKSITILVFVLALALAPLVIWDNPAFADFYGDMRRAFGMSQGYNASSKPVPNFANGYQVAGSNVTTTEAAYIDGLTAGTVTASKAVVVDANKDIGDFRNLDVVNLDAGASAVAGTVDVFPTTASKGKITIQATDNTTNHNLIITNEAVNGANKTLTIPALTGYAAVSTAACTLAEVDVLDGATAGTAVASKAVVLDANKDYAGIKALTLGTNGVGGAAGVLTVLDGANPGATVSVNYADVKKLDDLTASATELNLLTGATGLVGSVEYLTFTETAASGTYTATKVLPNNAIVVALSVIGHVNWGADTSAALSAGYTGSATAFANAEDVKAGAPTLAGFTAPVYFASGTTLTFVVTAVDATSTGGAGRDQFSIVWGVVTPTAATKS